MTSTRRTTAQRRDRQRAEAADAFYAALTGRDPTKDHDDDSQTIYRLVWAAFGLYQREWDIREWVWPVNELNEEKPFARLEPWAILLRKAVELARA